MGNQRRGTLGRPPSQRAGARAPAARVGEPGTAEELTVTWMGSVQRSLDGLADILAEQQRTINGLIGHVGTLADAVKTLQARVFEGVDTSGR